MKKARNLLHELRSEGWRPGRGIDVTSTRTFECLSEACGADSEGKAIRGATSELRLGDGAGDYSIRDLAENLIVNRCDGEAVGSDFVNTYLNPRNQRRLSEAMDAIDSSAFMDITGQLLITKIMERLKPEANIIRSLVPTYTSRFESEKWPGMGEIKEPGDDMFLTPEGEEFKTFGFGSNYVQSPLTKKRGGIVALTKETLFFDLTGKVVEAAKMIGDKLQLNEEKETIGCLIGSLTNFTPYIEKRQFDAGPVTMDLYQSPAGQGSGAGYNNQVSVNSSTRAFQFTNDVPSNPIVDFTCIEKADQYFTNTVDPNTGEPVEIGTPHMIASHTQRMRLMRVIQAESQYVTSQASLLSPGAVATQSTNLLSQIGMTPDKLVTSRQLKSQMMQQLNLTSQQADDVWFYGNPGEAITYVENWPIQVVSAPYNSSEEFKRDIVMQWKASKRGVVAITNPRALQRHNFLTELSSPGNF